MIIGLSGRAGSGKSTVASFLVKKHNFALRKFAGPLKDMFRSIGLTDREIEGHAKHQPCDLLCGKTPRHAMQTLGTEWGRHLIHPEIWTTLWANGIGQGQNIVSDDTRFGNEAKKIRELGGVVILIERTDALLLDESHPSEVMDFTPDHVVVNDGSIESLCARVCEMIELGDVAHAG